MKILYKCPRCAYEMEAQSLVLHVEKHTFPTGTSERAWYTGECLGCQADLRIDEGGCNVLVKYIYTEIENAI